MISQSDPQSVERHYNDQTNKSFEASGAFRIVLFINGKEEPIDANKAAGTMKTPHSSSMRAVAFFPLVEVQKHIHLHDYSDSEMDSCWYSDEEFQCIKDEIKLTLDLMEHEKIGDGELWCCMRGLESFTRFGVVRNKSNDNRHEMRYWMNRICNLMNVDATLGV
jgi:hypothetical protein